MEKQTLERQLSEIENLHLAIYSAIAHGLSDTNATSTDISIATENVIEALRQEQIIGMVEKLEAEIEANENWFDLFNDRHPDEVDRILSKIK